MKALATMDDLKVYGITVEADDTALAKRLLDSVSSAIRAAAGCPISLGEYTVHLPACPSRKLDLPTLAVKSVSRVLIDDKPVAGWKRHGSSLYRDEPWGPVGAVPKTVTVTFKAGWEPVPEDIIRLCCSYVAAGLRQQDDGGPGSHRGIAYERVDDAQVGYTQGDMELIDATELPEATKRSLRSRFGRNGTSIGMFR